MNHHYHHLYVDGDWREGFDELVDALNVLHETVSLHRITACLVGSYENRRAAEPIVLKDLDPDRTAHFDTGYEQRTLGIIRADLRSGQLNTGNVLYTHSKGAGQPIDGVSAPWRRCMTRRLVEEGEHCIELLEAGHDTVGCHWLTPEEHPKTVTIPYYGGNFWWATAAHLQRLPDPRLDTRYHAESWLGTVRPLNPADLVPGWPGAGCRAH